MPMPNTKEKIKTNVYFSAILSKIKPNICLNSDEDVAIKNSDKKE